MKELSLKELPQTSVAPDIKAFFEQAVEKLMSSRAPALRILAIVVGWSMLRASGEELGYDKSSEEVGALVGCT